MRSVRCVCICASIAASLLSTRAAAADDLWAMALSADQANRAGRYDDAIVTLSDIMKRYPKADNIDLAYGLICESYLAKRRNTVAQSYCSAAILRNPHAPRYFAARALANYRQGNSLDARHDCDTALALGGQKSWLIGLKARLLWEDGEVPAARAMAQSALAQDAHEVNARFVIAASRKSSGAKSDSASAPSVGPRPRDVLATVAAPDLPAADPQPRPRPELPSALTPNCKHPALVAERLICSDAHLRHEQAVMMLRLDRALDGVADEAALADDQRQWIVGQRNQCSDKRCLEAAYIGRMAILSLLSWD
ncbi:MAG: hypothetical protein WCD42_02840 [Rhizomicrobium sp.]